jgi:choline-phosphate cytidylyltransferase
MKIVYIDGVFDLFHRGHLESLIKAKNVLNDISNTFLIVGVVSDKDCESYKRKPIIKEDDRVEIIKGLKIVDNIIFPCPLIVTPEFLEKNNIDLVVHGFVDENDRQKQKEFFAKIVELGKFKEIEYYKETSTTKIIKNIKDNY